MPAKRKHFPLIALGIAIVVAYFLVAPFALAAYMIQNLDYEEGSIREVPFEAYRVIYAPWLDELPDTNPYKQLFIGYWEYLCSSRPESCS